MSFTDLTIAELQSFQPTCGIESLRVFRELESTNSWAIAHADQFSTADLPLLVICHQQTAGRGRSGRNWFADSGTLTFSILDSARRMGLELKAISQLALVAGLSVAEAIDDTIPPYTARIKWPNDVLIDGGKVAGILTENVAKMPGRFVVGIGVNVSTNFQQADDDVRSRGQSLSAVANRDVNRFEVLVAILQRFRENVAALGEGGFTGLRAIQDRCLLTGQTISLQQGSERITGVCRGIDEGGGLIVETDAGLRKIHSGEVVRFTS